MSLCGHVFISRGYLSSCAIAGFYGKFVINLLGNFQTVFQNGGHHFAFPPVVMREGSDFSTSSPIPAVLYFLMIAIPVGMKWYLVVASVLRLFSEW